MPRFQDIPKFPHSAYEVDIGWGYLEQHIKSHEDEMGLNLEPNFQRAHVWTPAQQTLYIEYQLAGGEVGKNLTFNHTMWNDNPLRGSYVIVDGKQRLRAVRMFMHDELKAFGHVFSEYTDRLRIHHAGFKWRVCSLATRAEVLNLYLSINAGGTPHTSEELDQVRALLNKEHDAQAQQRRSRFPRGK